MTTKDLFEKHNCTDDEIKELTTYLGYLRVKPCLRTASIAMQPDFDKGNIIPDAKVETEVTTQSLRNMVRELRNENMELRKVADDFIQKYGKAINQVSKLNTEKQIEAMGKHLAKQIAEAENELVENILSEFERIGIDTSEWEERFGDGNFAHEFIAAGIQFHLDKIIQSQNNSTK